MPENIIINKFEIAPGENREIQLNIARLPTYTNMDLPVHVYRSQKDGPVLLLTGGLHGDEINGIEIVRQMIVNELAVPDKGTVIAIPLVNVYGFIQNSRGVPDGKDINRSFPGVETGSLARQVAHTLMKEIIPHVDIGIDYHTGGATRSHYPHIRCSLHYKKNRELAEAFGPPIIINYPLIDNSFRKAAQYKGKQILVFETGEALRFDKTGIREGIDGTLRLMKHLGMRSTAPRFDGTKTYLKTTWVRADYAGLFQPGVKTGDHTYKSQVLGHITDPFGKSQYKVTSTRKGRVVGLNHGPVVHKGDAIINLAYN